MINRTHLFIFITVFLSFIGCSEDPDIAPAGETITCSTHELSFGSSADTVTVDISVTNEWTIYGTESWITCSPSSSINTSETVSVFVTQNSTSSERSAFLVVKSGSTRDTISVSQDANENASNIDSIDGYSLVWHDEFDGEISSDWIFETGNGSSGWGNNELEYYLKANATVVDGALNITAKKESQNGYSYTSTRMKTMGNAYWTYGIIEARIKMPAFSGAWPAFWMLGENISTINWPQCGEIDIMEHINSENRSYGTIHWYNEAYTSYGGNISVNDITEYHKYKIEWDENAIKWFVDDVQYEEANIKDGVNGTDEFHEPFFILLNFAIGGNWPGFTIDDSAFPATMCVDYVRVYQED